jgi:hypothetical protein
LQKTLINKNILDMLERGKGLKISLKFAEDFIQRFVKLFPNDRDTSIFRDDLKSLQSEISQLETD